MANYTASWDMLTFFHVLQRKLVKVGAKAIKDSGLRSVTAIPEPRRQQMIVFRQLYDRFEKGKFNYAEREADTVADLAVWIANEHARQHGHPEKQEPILPWRQWWIATNTTTTPPPRRESFERAASMAYEVEQYVAEQTGE